ncbi:hypothetical protein D3C87_2103190 [compost metagenome]
MGGEAFVFEFLQAPEHLAGVVHHPAAADFQRVFVPLLVRPYGFQRGEGLLELTDADEQAGFHLFFSELFGEGFFLC